MEEVPGGGSGSRRNEDIALDLMKFVAMTTGYGRTTSTGVGFQGGGAAAKPEEYAGHLLELYGGCLAEVAGKKYTVHCKQLRARRGHPPYWRHPEGPFP